MVVDSGLRLIYVVFLVSRPSTGLVDSRFGGGQKIERDNFEAQLVAKCGLQLR
jgi:hypothetical protein